MPKFRAIIEPPPLPQGGDTEQISALRDYITRIMEELAYLLTHLEADNIDDTTWQRIQNMIPRPYTGLPATDGVPSSGSAAEWSRGDHRHGTDTSRAAAQDLTDHAGDTANPHAVTKAQVGLGNVDNVQQYSASNPPPIPTPGEVGAVPVTREINGYALSADVTLDYSDVGAIPASDKGTAGGVAELDANGHVPSSQLPSYVDDVKEYPSVTDFPIPGESDKIYIALDTDLFYRWGGTVYAPTNPSLALGETSSTAYRGDRGKTAYDHSQVTSGNPHNVTASDIGLGNVANERQYSADNPPPVPDAEDIPYDNTSSGMTADDVQEAIDELAGMIPEDAGDISYDNTSSGLSASDVQAALDELAQGTGSTATAVSYDNTGSGMSATNVQDAIDEVLGDIPAVPSASSATPQDLGTAAAGSSGDYSRADHVHKKPTAADIGAYVKPSGGIPGSDLASGVVPAISTSTPQMDGTGVAGSTGEVSDAGHVHPTDTSRVPVYGMGQNLLRNAHFIGGGTGWGVLPVNQRGFNTSSGVNGIYCIDGWYINGGRGVQTLQSGGLYYNNNSGSGTTTIQQWLGQPGEYQGKTVTMSAVSDGVLYYDTATVQAAAASDQVCIELSTNGTRIRFIVLHTGSAAGYIVQLGAPNGTSATVQAVKLELGTEQTLAHLEGSTWVLNKLPNYETELIRCQTSTADSTDTYANKSLATEQELAYVETGTTTSRAYAVGECFCWNGLSYRVSQPISSGGTITPGSNCEAMPGGISQWTQFLATKTITSLPSGVTGTVMITSIGKLRVINLSNIVFTNYTQGAVIYTVDQGDRPNATARGQYGAQINIRSTGTWAQATHKTCFIRMGNDGAIHMYGDYTTGWFASGTLIYIAEV